MIFNIILNIIFKTNSVNGAKGERAKTIKIYSLND